MRKVLLLIGISMAFFSPSKAQWTTSGANAYFNLTGNVSVGTTTSSAKFAVTSSSSSTFSGLASVADFLGTAADRARINILNNYNSPTKGSSSAIIFGGYNFAGTGMEIKWEVGTDYQQNGARNFYFYNTATSTAPIYLDANGSVGISATSPIAMFQVEDGAEKASIGPASGTGLLGTSYLGFNAARSGTNWTVNSDFTHNGAGVIYGDIFGNINFAAIADVGNTNQFLSDASLKSKVVFQITPSGLTRAKQIKIELTGWSDYVFDKDYQLPTLEAVKTFIDKNHHLPDVPSATNMIKDGLDVGEMNKLLIKKVEELTLYLIEKDKQLKDQQAQLNNIKQMLNKRLKVQKR